jgi:hypothetical protein
LQKETEAEASVSFWPYPAKTIQAACSKLTKKVKVK